MSKNNPIIDQIRVNKPCTADWDSMIGNDELRFCEHCAKSVHDLSSMTRVRAEKLVIESGGSLCIRHHRLPDGAIQTSDGLVRFHRIARRASQMAAGAFTVALIL